MSEKRSIAQLIILITRVIALRAASPMNPLSSIRHPISPCFARVNGTRGFTYFSRRAQIQGASARENDGEEGKKRREGAVGGAQMGRGQRPARHC